MTAINTDRSQLAQLGAEVLQRATAPRASDLIEAEPAEDAGWKSRKLIITVCLIAALLAIATVGCLVLGQYDAAQTWHPRLSEAGAIHLVELAVLTGCSYLGINFLSTAATIAGQIFGRRQ